MQGWVLETQHTVHMNPEDNIRVDGGDDWQQKVLSLVCHFRTYAWIFPWQKNS